VIWLSTDIVDALLRFYLAEMFIPGEGNCLTTWTESCRDLTERAHVTIGPICIAIISPHLNDHYLHAGNWAWHKKNFQFIGIINGGHYTTYVNPVVIDGLPVPHETPGPEWRRCIFDDFYACKRPIVWKDPNAVIAPESLIPLASHLLRPPPRL
jgi:hypothetical protein